MCVGPRDASGVAVPSEPVHPEPPPDLHGRALPLIEARGPWARAYRLAHSPHYFGRGGSERFDDPQRAFGVCYVGDSVACAFVETLPAQVDLPHRVVLGVYRAALADRGWAHVTVLGDDDRLRLVDLTGSGLALLGADADLCSCRDYAVPQRWSRALWSHPDQPDGILYRARHDPSRTSVALFDDRVDGRITMTAQGAWSDALNIPLLRGIVTSYGIAILPGERP